MGYYVGANGYYEGDKAELNDIEVPQRPSPAHVWENKKWVTSLSDNKERLISSLTQSRKEAVVADIKYKGSTFQACDKSLQAMSKYLVSGSVPEDFYWVDVNNKQVSMTFAELKGLYNVILDRDNTLFKALQEKKAKIRAAKTQKELDKYS